MFINNDFSDSVRTAKFFKKLISQKGIMSAKDFAVQNRIKFNWNDYGNFIISYKLQGSFGIVKLIKDHNMWFCITEKDEAPIKIR